MAVSADYDDLTGGQAESLIERIEAEFKQAHPQLSSIYIRPGNANLATRHLMVEDPRRAEALQRDGGRDLLLRMP